jgi:site-specific DNA-methyltransferase (adenine-specific)
MLAMMNKIKQAELHNIDCMAYMATLPDKAFDLAIVDPPYGINMDGGKIGIKGSAEVIDYAKKDWDKFAPSKDYFIELQRVSKNQIIWGANHFVADIPNASSPCWIVWDKEKVGGFFADSELAYTSFKTAVRNFKFQWHGMLQGDMKNKEHRIHPTQKPVKLYEWLLTNYAEKGQKILDTHLGSGSIAVACNNLGFDLVGCELDQDYYKDACNRITLATAQERMFA